MVFLRTDYLTLELDHYRMTSLKAIASAAAPLSLVVAERLLERLANQGVDVKLIQGNSMK